MAENTAPPDTNVTPGTTPPEVPSAFSLFKPSWEGLKVNLLELILIVFIPSLALTALFLAAASASNSSSSSAGILLGLGALAAVVYGVLIGPAIIHIQLKSSRMEKATYESAWATSKKYWWRFLILSIAVGVVVFVGFLLLIVPGIIFLRRYFLSHFALIDQDLGTGDSMRTSNELSKGRSMSIFGIIGVDILIGIPSVIPVVGSVITFVLQIAYFCAPAVRYQQLKALKPVAPKA